MLPFVFALLVAIQAPVQPASQDEIKDGLSRAESLYYEAKFVESIQLLARVNDALQTKPDRVQDKITTKLQLALANIGLNDAASAKSFLAEIYALDPDYVLDARQFSPKVIALANDARNEQIKVRCREAGENARKTLAAGDSTGILNILQSTKAKCPELASVEPEAAELLYKTGLAQYRQGSFPAALRAFRAALKLDPKHELAAQYLDLAENKLQIAQDRSLMQWQKNFDAQQYKDAASNYRELVSLSDDSNAQTLNRVTAEYRKTLGPLVDAWNRACPGGDAARISQIRSQITELLPEPSFAVDLRSKMVDCTVRESPSPVPPVPQVAAKIDAKSGPSAARSDAKSDAGVSTYSGCIPMESQLALTRLKSRVDPEIPREARAYIQNSQIAVRIKARIDQSGNVTVLEATGTNPILNNSVRTAVEHWKFSPTSDVNGLRCVDTEILVMVGK